MNKFIYRTLLFALPLLVLMVPPILSLYTSGENYKNLDEVIESPSKYLIGYAYNERNYKYLKWRRVDGGVKTEVIVLGSSRVLQFRDQMFQTSFYNAGYTISRIGDFIPFLESISADKYPRYLIIGLDQWMFNENWDDFSKVKKSSYWADSFKYRADFSTIMDAWKDLLTGKIKLLYKNGGAINYIGLNAFINNTGFRSDGSMHQGSQIEKLLKNDRTANDYRYSDTFSRIENGNKRFQYGDTVNAKALAELDRLLSFCKSNGIFVVGMLPPFALQVNEKMDQTGKYGYMQEIYPESKEIFDQYGFELYDFTRSGDFGADDSEALDGFHLGEVAYAKLLIKMLESGSILNAVANIEELESAGRVKVNRYTLYEY